MHAFSRLLKTDLRNRRTALWMTLTTLVLLHGGFVSIPYFTETPPYPLILNMNVILFVVALSLPFLHAFNIWLEEWRHNTVFRLLSLPVHRTKLLLAKYAAIVIEVLLITGVMLLGLSVQNGLADGQLFRSEPLLTWGWSTVAFVFSLLLLMSGLIFLIFFSVLLGRSAGRWPFLTTFLSFVAGLAISSFAFALVPSTVVLAVLGLAFFWGCFYWLEQKTGIA
ncbi:ABC-2 transporter permease [Paenibacillus sp. HJGM_3]|uniref:ABC-2 transporter permease n=1 Tax=Paenibacillus sp. HJGM_3 TaxID=3379816 RepID=UPI00385BA3E0